jgi:hypothetical protein
VEETLNCSSLPLKCVPYALRSVAYFASAYVFQGLSVHVNRVIPVDTLKYEK